MHIPLPICNVLWCLVDTFLASDNLSSMQNLGQVFCPSPREPVSVLEIKKNCQEIKWPRLCVNLCSTSVHPEIFGCPETTFLIIYKYMLWSCTALLCLRQWAVKKKSKTLRGFDFI